VRINVKKILPQRIQTNKRKSKAQSSEIEGILQNTSSELL
jgi:hypothetical protein